jgi:hypothetical protein
VREGVVVTPVEGIDKRRVELVGIDEGAAVCSFSLEEEERGMERRGLGYVMAHRWGLREDKTGLATQGDAQQAAARWPDYAVAGMGTCTGAGSR